MIFDCIGLLLIIIIIDLDVLFSRWRYKYPKPIQIKSALNISEMFFIRFNKNK